MLFNCWFNFEITFTFANNVIVVSESFRSRLEISCGSFQNHSSCFWIVWKRFANHSRVVWNHCKSLWIILHPNLTNFFVQLTCRILIFWILNDLETRRGTSNDSKFFFWLTRLFYVRYFTYFNEILGTSCRAAIIRRANHNHQWSA